MILFLFQLQTSLKTSRDARFALEQLDDDERQSGDGQAETAGSSRKESIKRRERFSNNPFEFEVRAPKNVRCDDSGNQCSSDYLTYQDLDARAKVTCIYNVHWFMVTCVHVHWFMVTLFMCVGS